mmetsp:Transcript_60769/g.144745  ORF Transcript_60769/g.144745 Transcript_60769/m.144745 type:complete len:135 (-) Transcript_60769:144-548(-)|eukprot:CAMPEP_0178403742 /NCGR_PEP_ID=MMETSP0689_2-20121128/17526_1 /TAXON_ID=160604 /ORGANISM="Amphidinium massartii, Strain CS-259" /LENGTH=134 /DNA_ID=CAMNT_0020024707 /DNA_START=104 /DNA_END=508 /DNA_ORIENTATION=+
MVLGRFAAAARSAASVSARSAFSPVTRVAAAPAFNKFASMSATRSAATAVSMPRPLSIRFDGLFVQVFIAAVLYFAPQDVVVLGIGLWAGHSAASNKAPSGRHADPDAAVEEWKAKKGLDNAKVSGSRTVYVTL